MIGYDTNDEIYDPVASSFGVKSFKATVIKMIGSQIAA